jgi:putative transposase
MLDIVASPTTPRFAFGKYDEILISGKSYRLFETREDGHYFVRVDGTDVVQKLTNSEISRWLQMGNFVRNPNALAPPGSQKGIELPHDLLSAMSPKQHRRAAQREAMVMAFQELYREGTVKKTDASIMANMRAIRARAGEFLERKSDGPTPMDDVIPIPKIRSAKSLRRFLKAYEEFGLAGLYDHVDRRGNRDRRLTCDELMLMNKVVTNYIGERNLTQKQVAEDVWNAFDAANEERRAEGKTELMRPSRATIRNAIRALDPFAVSLGRNGADKTRNAVAPVGTGIEVHRPLQRVEIDEWRADVVSIMAEAGVLHRLTEEEKQALGLDGERAGWTVTVAICVRTRCIVGMVISRKPNTKSALRVIEMIMRDKGVWSDAVDALTSWNQYGWPSVIVTDCAKYNISHEVRVRAKDAGVTVLHTPAAAPRMKPYIERAFRTMAVNLMPRLRGRTFSNVIEKGDHEPEKGAVLNAEDFCAAMVRWIVDIFHRSPTMVSMARRRRTAGTGSSRRSASRRRPICADAGWCSARKTPALSARRGSPCSACATSLANWRNGSSTRAIARSGSAGIRRISGRSPSSSTAAGSKCPRCSTGSQGSPPRSGFALPGPCVHRIARRPSWTGTSCGRRSRTSRP